MKDSGINWIGEIPKHWEVSAIKRNFQLYSGATPKTDNELYWNGGVAWITPADYKTEDRWIECGSRYISEEGFKSCAVTMLPKGSIIFSKRAPIGLVIMNSTPLCTNQGCIGCVPFNGNGDYYYYAMSICSEQFELLGSGTTFKEISATSFSNFILPTPTIEEQYRIANFLDKKCAEIDELIVLQEQMIAQLTTYKQAVITETVTKGLDPNVKMKDSGVEWIGEIPEHWSICRIKNLCREEQYAIKTGPFGTQLKGDDLKEEGDVCVYNQRNVIDADFNKVHSYVLIEKANSLKSFFTKPNDLLITTRGTIGRTAVLTKDYPMGILHPCLIALRIKQEISMNWLRYFFQTECFKTDILLSSNATTIEVIYTDNLKNVSLPFPPLSEQKSIANYLDQKCKEIDELISIKKEKIEYLKAYKKSVIYEYVTGKKRL